ncbi:aldo/keto reductase [Pseudonocardia oceani]|uniref:aldo/keto reductase n=1 Tax=Pseudonocardia oceani TaxID=2792013 RepID=UPI001CF64A98|nr:aldo/keto reductase [Pseudonocardia oceani]
MSTIRTPASSAAPGEYDVRADAAYVRRACDASLRRLRSDRIDLYYLHQRSDTVPIEETVTALAGLVDARRTSGSRSSPTRRPATGPCTTRPRTDRRS